MLRSLILVVAGMIITGLTSLYVIFGYRFFRRGPDAVHEVARWWGGVILRLAKVDVEVSGDENVIGSGPMVFMANHQSWFDIFIVLASVPCQFRFLAKKELFEVPVFGGALRKYAAIPIDRKNFVSAMRSIEAAAKQVREGKSVMTFPEGTRSRDGQIQPFKKGVFHLALRAGVPIVPISIVGAAEIMPKKTLWVHPGKVQMRIGRPVAVTDYTVETLDDLMDRVRNVVMQNYDAGNETTAGG